MNAWSQFSLLKDFVSTFQISPPFGQHDTAVFMFCRHQNIEKTNVNKRFDILEEFEKFNLVILWIIFSENKGRASNAQHSETLFKSEIHHGTGLTEGKIKDQRYWILRELYVSLGGSHTRIN